MDPGSQQTPRGNDFGYSLRQNRRPSAKKQAAVELEEPARRQVTAPPLQRDATRRQQNNTAPQTPVAAPVSRRGERPAASQGVQQASARRPYIPYLDSAIFREDSTDYGSVGNGGRALQLHRQPAYFDALGVEDRSRSPTDQRIDRITAWNRNQPDNFFNGPDGPNEPAEQDIISIASTRTSPAPPPPASRSFSMTIYKPNRLPLALSLRRTVLTGANFDGVFVVEKPQSMTIWAVREVIALFAQTPCLLQRIDAALVHRLGLVDRLHPVQLGRNISFEFVGMEGQNPQQQQDMMKFFRRIQSRGLTLGERGNVSDLAVNDEVRAFFRAVYAVPETRRVVDGCLGGISTVEARLREMIGA